MQAALQGKSFSYDVCLSFAGEDRPYVKQVADVLRERRIRVFYDEYERAQLWGKNLYTHLDEVYGRSARFCVVFVSAHYAKKLWTKHEKDSAQARAFAENEEYILPARFDDTEIPGIRPTVAFIDLRRTSPVELAELIITKLGALPRAAVFIDGDWLIVATKHMGIQVDFKLLLLRLQEAFGEGVAVSVQLTEHIGRQGGKRLVSELAGLGYEVEALRSGGPGKRIYSSGFDVRLALRAAELPANFHMLVLLSGDSDFTPLLEQAKKSGRTTVVVALPDLIGVELKAVADRFVSLHEFMPPSPPGQPVQPRWPS